MNDGQAGQPITQVQACLQTCVNSQRLIPISHEICVMQELATCMQKRGPSAGQLIALGPVSPMLSFHNNSPKLFFDFNFLHGTCVGQASNPGPWSLQLQNVVSASKHIADFRMEHDCVLWTETCANKFTQERVRRHARKGSASAVCSNPAPIRCNSTGKGGRAEATGSIIFASTPIQNLGGSWDAAIFASGRIADAVIHVSSMQIRVIAIYGYHSGITESLQKNEKLMAHAFARASQFHVPTLIAGDLNCDINALAAWTKAQALGYVDVAARQAVVADTVTEMTYRGVSRLDYVICNPCAARAFQSLHVDPKGFTDHAVLTAFFDWRCVLQPPVVWTMPFDLGKLQALKDPLKETPVLPGHVCHFRKAVQHGSFDAAAKIFTEAFESKARDVHERLLCKPLKQAFLGRLSGKWAKRCPQTVSVSKEADLATDRVQVRHRLRVLDRLRELCNLVQRNTSPRLRQLWMQLLKAKGFQPDFPSWLMDNEIVDYVPLAVPSEQWLTVVIAEMVVQAKHWDELRSRQQKQSYANIFNEDWKHGGSLHARAVKEPACATLDGLLRDTELQVRLRRASKHSPACFTVAEPTHVKVGAMWTFGKIQATVVALRGNEVQLDRQPTIEMTRKSVRQSSWSADTAYIAEEVQAYWNSFWNAEQQLDHQVMHDILQGMPDIPRFDPVITLSDLQFSVKRLNPHKARGMDGWSNAELQLLNDEELSMLVELFNAIMDAQVWPETLTSAWVALLAKVPQPLQPKDGRPITVLPTLYRLWSKVMATKTFKAMLPFLPENLYGSVPGKSTMDAAWELQSLLEESMEDQDQVVGVSLDLSKAYNTLPRSFLYQLALKSGWPASLIKTYDSFLGSLTRFFRIHDGLHLGTKSKVGVPEGCPLAVPMMILLTMGVTNLVQCRQGQLLSYVDNWTMTTSTVGTLRALLHTVKWATDGLCLLLNPEKTVAFATTPQARTELRSMTFAGVPMNVVHVTHDLGVTFSSTCKATSTSILDRLTVNQSKLDRLQMLPWKSYRKCKTLQRVIAPSILYGSALASTPPSLLATMRGKFSVAIWGRGSHRNHFLAPLLSTADVYEPYHWIFRERLQALRRAACQQPMATARRWNKLCHIHRATGPFRYFIEFVHQIGWWAQQDFWVQASGKSLNLVFSPFADIMDAMKQDWLIHVADKLADKEEWSGLHWIDWKFTQTIRGRSKFDAASIGNFTTGAAIFSDQKKHFLHQDSVVCVHCGQHDSQNHRIFQCNFYETARQHRPMQLLQSLPQLQTQKGLFRKPYAIQQWETLVGNIPMPDFYQEFDDHVYIFTDGSTFSPTTVPSSAWAVVLAESHTMDATIVETGWLSGRQDNYRAELCAVLVAIQHCACATIFSDNESVVRGLLRLQIWGWQPVFWIGHDHFDLWQKVWLLWSQKQPQNWEVRHVRAHKTLASAKSWQEAWCIYNNAVADSAAQRKNRSRPQSHIETLAMARMEFNRVTKQAASIFGLQQDVLHLAKKTSRKMGPQQAIQRFWGQHFQVDAYTVHKTEAMLCPRFLSVLASFFKGEWLPCDPPVSLLEVYLNFVEATGWLVPINISDWQQNAVPIQWRSTAASAWLHESSWPELVHARQLLSKQLNTFQHAVRRLLTTMKVDASFIQHAALTQYGKQGKVQCITAVPRVCKDSPEVLIAFAKRRSLAELLKTTFHPSKTPIHSDLEQVNPNVLWNLYMRRR